MSLHFFLLFTSASESDSAALSREEALETSQRQGLFRRQLTFVTEPFCILFI